MCCRMLSTRRQRRHRNACNNVVHELQLLLLTTRCSCGLIGFSNRSLYEASIRQPVGRDWNTTVSSRFTHGFFPVTSAPPLALRCTAYERAADWATTDGKLVLWCRLLQNGRRSRRLSHDWEMSSRPSRKLRAARRQSAGRCTRHACGHSDIMLLLCATK